MSQYPFPPGWHVNGLAGLPQTQVELQEQLCLRFHFTLDDLLWNRQGSFSPAQRTFFERENTRYRRRWRFWFVRFGLLLLLLFIFLGPAYRHLSQGFTSELTAVDLVLYSLPLFCGLLSFTLLYIPFPRRDIPTPLQFQTGVVSMTEGFVESHEEIYGDFPSDYFYHISNLSFKIGNSKHSPAFKSFKVGLDKYLPALKDTPCRLFYAPGTRKDASPGVIVSIELLGPPNP